MNQQGRSMVEILGVLAIIGVLSIGAIAGYGKAMMKYKLNKQTEQLTSVINTGLRYAGQWNFSENTNTIPYFIKLGEVPKEMIRPGVLTSLYDVFGTSIYTLYTIYGEQRYTQLFIRLDTSKNDENSLSICRNIVTVAKEFHANVRSITILSGSGADSKGYMGDVNCTGSSVCMKDLTVELIEDLCRHNLGKNEIPHLKINWTE